MDLKTFGKKIRLLRQSNSLSQENIANDLGISITAYSKIERGVTNVSITRLFQLAEYFGITAPELLDWQNKPVQRKKTETESNPTSAETKTLPYDSDSIVDHLKRENAALKELVKAKDEIITLLKQKNRY